MVENITNIKKIEEETLAVNPSAVIPGYFSAEEIDALSPYEVGNIAVSLSGSRKAVNLKNIGAKSDSGYVLNTKELSSNVTKAATVKDILSSYAELLAVLTSAQKEKLSGYITANDLLKTTEYLLELKNSYTAELERLKSNRPYLSGLYYYKNEQAIKNIENNILPRINNCLSEINNYATGGTTVTVGGTSGATEPLIETKYTTVEEVVDGTPIFSAPDVPAAAADISTIINYQIADIIYQLQNNDDFYETFYADRLDEIYGEYFDNEETEELELLINGGNVDELTEYLEDLLNSSQEMLEHLQDVVSENPQYASGVLLYEIEQLREKIKLIEDMQSLDYSVLVEKYFNKVETDFIIPKTEEIEELKEKLLFYANLQKLMTILAQAKYDGYNVVKQVMENVSGYQGMNLSKTNTKQIESLVNYVNTRKAEIYEYVNNYNEKVKAEIEAELEADQENDLLGFINRAGLGVLSALAGLIAMIFSAGITAPLVMSSITTTYEVINTNKEAESDIAIKEKLEALEEELALLRAAEQREEREILESKIEEMLERRKISKLDFLAQTGLSEAEWDLFVSNGFIDDAGKILDKFYDDPEAFYDLAVSAGADIDAVRKQLNGNYQTVINLEIYINQCLMSIDNIDKTINGYYSFDNQRYLENSRYLTGLNGIMNAYQSVFSAQLKSRNIVAAELGLTKTSESDYSSSVFQQAVKDTLTKLQRFNDLQYQQVQSSNAARTLREEIAKTKLSSFFQTISSIGLQLINTLTYNAAAPFVKNLLGSLGKGFFDYYSSSYVNNTYDYNAYALNDINAAGLLSAEYAELFDAAGYDELIYHTAGSRTAVNYDQYLELLKKIEFINIVNGIKLTLHGMKTSSRNMIHDILTDQKGYTANTAVASANYESEQNLTEDVLKKQVGLAAEVSEANNRKALAQLEVHKSGLSILTSSLSGLLGGYFSTAEEESSQLFAKILGYFIQNSGSDLLEMSLSNSDFNLSANNGYSSSAGYYKVTQNTDNAVLELLNDSYTVEDSSGQLYVDVEKLAKKIMEINRLASLNQVIAAAQETSRKSREMIMSILTEKAGAAAESISKKQAQVITNSLQGQIEAIYQNLLEINKILSQRNVKLTQAQRNLYTGIIQSGVAGLGGTSFKPEQIATIADAAGLAARTSFALIDINDDTASRMTAANLSDDSADVSLSEAMALSKVEEHEQELLIQSLKVKQSIGKYGMNSADLSTLEYLSILLKKIQKFKEKLMSLYEEIAASRNDVSAAMTSIASELELISKQVSKNVSMLNKSLFGVLKKATEDKVNSLNIQQRKELNSVMSIFDGAVSSVQGAGAFTEGGAKETYSNYAFYLSGLNDSLKSLVSLKYENTAKSGGSSAISTKGLTAAEALAVETAGLQEDLALLRSAEELIKYTNKLVNSGVSNTANLLEGDVCEEEFYLRVEELLADKRLKELRAETAGYEYSIAQKRAESSDIFNEFVQNSEWYELYFNEAHKYFLKADYQKASELLQKKFTPEFLASVNSDQLSVPKIQKLMTLTKELAEFQSKYEEKRVDRDQAETRFFADKRRINEALKNIYERYKILGEKNDKFQKALTSMEEPSFQQGLNTELNAAFNNGTHSFAENLSKYLLLSDKEAKAIELSISSPYYQQVLRETRDYVNYYRALMKDVVLIAKIQDDFDGFSQVLMDHNNRSYTYKGRPAKEYFSVLLANNLYVNYLDREKSARGIIGNFDQITKELGKVNKAKRQELELDKREVVMAVLKATYEGVENYQTLSDADREHQVRVYDKRWRDMYNLYVDQSKLNLRKRDLAQDWQAYFQENSYKEEDKRELSVLKRDLKQARADQKEIAQLFAKYGENEKVDINTANISRELKGYILHITGNNPTYNARTREIIKKYVERKINGLEVKIANKETDVNFAIEVYQNSQQEMVKLEEEYNELWLDYQNSYREMADEKLLKEKLNKLKNKEVELESARIKYRNRYEQYQKKMNAGVLNNY